MKYSLKRYLLNEGRRIPGVVDEESKDKAIRNRQKFVGWLLEELNGEWEVSEPKIVDDPEEGLYFVTVQMSNGSDNCFLKTGWTARETGSWSALKQEWESEVLAWAGVWIGDSSYTLEGVSKYDTLTSTTKIALQRCLKKVTLTNPELLKNMKKQVPGKKEVSQIKRIIKDWCKDTVSGTNYDWIRLDSSGLSGQVRSNIDQRDFLDEDGDDYGGKTEDQEYSFTKSLQHDLAVWRMAEFVNKAQVYYVGHEKGWLSFKVELNS